MSITLKVEELCSVLWLERKIGQERIEVIEEFLKTSHNANIDPESIRKLENFLKLFDVKMKSVQGNTKKFKSKYCDWMDTDMEISIYTPSSGAPRKLYDDLCPKSKKKRLAEKLSTISNDEVLDTFKEMLKKENQPKEAVHIANILPSASSKRLKRIVKSIPTPTSQSNFTEEEAIALMLKLGLSPKF